ncbi:MAG: ribonuclease P protein component [Coriobacteriia bacterium]|nr:ribonuclease P protein component [Coriobacteriia bacterium]
MRTITAHADIDRLFARGSRTTHPALIVLAVETPEARDPNGRVLFVAGKKLGSAVMRNRSKRVMRAATRRAGGSWPGWDVALVARRGTHSAAPEVIDAALAAAVQRLRRDR